MVQNRLSGQRNRQTTDDKKLQNLLDLIVNEQNSQLMTSLSERVSQLENEVLKIQKNADLKINKAEQEMRSKLNEMSVRLSQMEQFNANVSKLLQTEKKNRGHLEQLYTALANKHNSSTIATESVLTSSDMQLTTNNLMNLITSTQIKVIDLDKRLENVSNENNALKHHIVNLTRQTHVLLNVTGDVLKVTTQKRKY